MRIVAGTLRGRSIAAPEGLDTRPTTDRVREALFSSLYSLRGGFQGAIVLDAFAGSGALGIEAISRGAEAAVFFEQDRKAVSVLKRNVEGCGVSSHCKIVSRDVLNAPPTGQVPPFDMIFLDPPYAYKPEVVIGMVQSLRELGALAVSAIVVYEHDAGAAEAVGCTAEDMGFKVQAQKTYGKTSVTILADANPIGEEE